MLEQLVAEQISAKNKRLVNYNTTMALTQQFKFCIGLGIKTRNYRINHNYQLSCNVNRRNAECVVTLYPASINACYGGPYAS